MNEEIAKSVIKALAREMGGLWFAAEGDDGVNSNLFRPGEGVTRKKYRLAYGDSRNCYVTFCHGNTWVEAVEDYVKVCRWPEGSTIPEWLKADSAEELVLRVALSEVS